MNLNHLAIFRAVAEEKSVSRAGNRLMISQPAVSKQLQLLEKDLGTVLFDRHPRGVRLTAAGETLADYARRIFTLASDAERAMRELKGLERGRLSIGASTTIGVYLLPEIFVQFRQRYPNLQTTMEVANSQTIQQRLVEDSLDVGFMEVVPATDERLDTTQIASDELVAIAPPGHPMLRARHVSAQAFCAQPFVVRETGSDTKSFVEHALAERGIAVNPVMSLGSTEAIKRAVAAGVGVAIVSRLAIALELRARTLGVVRVSGISIRRPLFCVRHRGRTESSALLAFLSLARENLSQLEAAFAREGLSPTRRGAPARKSGRRGG